VNNRVTGSSKIRKYGRRILVFVAIMVSLVFVSSYPAQAATGPVGTAKIGQLSSVGILTSSLTLTNKKIVLNTIIGVSSRSAKSVYITSMKVCYSGAANSVIYLYPTATSGGGDAGANLWSSPVTPRLVSGTCYTFTINRNYTTIRSDNEIFEVHHHITAGANERAVAIDGFYR
jgi:hypothetical protein